MVYGAADTKAGCCGSVTDLFAMPFNHHPVVEQGLRAEEAQELLQGVFQGSAGTACGPAEVETACMTGMEYEETVKKWKLREKVGGFRFLFSANCAILLMVFCRNPSYAAVCRAERGLDRIRMDAERTAMGRTDISCTAYLCSAEITTGGLYSCTKMNLN